MSAQVPAANPARRSDAVAEGGRKPIEVEARFCPAELDPFSTVEWDRRSATIKDESGQALFEQKNCEVPAKWSQLATNVVVSKYFYGENSTPERETSVRQLIHRVTRTIADWGREDGYFASSADSERFYRDLTWLCLHQYGAFNSPVWFNVGLSQQYGVKGAKCNWRWDPVTREAVQPENPYDYPQGSACFIQSVGDNMEDIMELARSEAMLFKYGSGTGTDLSTLRSHREKLSGGGRPSGPLSFMRVYDQIACVVKSGGKTRRAAKMQSLKVHHPDILEFIEAKSKEEKKARTLIQAGYDANFNGEAYSSILFQNANLSVRVSDEFMRAVEDDRLWTTHWITDATRNGPSWPARELFGKMAEGAWFCGDPGVQYDTTINKWHTCPNSGRINGSNPCVTGDTLVSTAEGYRPIRALVGGEAILVDRDGVRREVKKIFPTGRKPVYRLTTKGGYELKLTADHKVYTSNRGDVPACELTRDDRLVLNPVGFGFDELAVERAELIGLLLGDGCTARTPADGDAIASISLDDAAERSIVEQARDRMAGIEAEQFGGRPRPKNDGSRRSSAVAAARASTRAKAVADLIARYAVLDAGEEGKRLTEAAFGLERTAVAGLLRGLFTADGCVTDAGEKTQAVVLDSISCELLQQVQMLLLGFGVKSKLLKNRRIGGLVARKSNGRGGVQDFPVGQSHSLRIVQSSRVRFEKEIGFWPGSDKQAKLELVNRSVPARLERMEEEPVSLEYLGEEEVFDLTEPVTSHFGANGLCVHNCSEYMFLDDSACNLASINLMKFRRDDGTFDAESFQAVARIYFIAQEILVDHASYPTAKIAVNSHRFRPLGLGYANLGSLLMSIGVPYDSAQGRGLCGAITALLHGAANRTSVELAHATGPFEGYPENRDPMLNVMKMHREAVEKIDASCPAYLRHAARKVWDDVLEGGAQYGFRNAQATVLAPTGTIAFLMDCDTTGIEPDIALVKYKQLAGGGMMKIVNRTVPMALRTMGYDDDTVNAALQYIDQHDKIEGFPALKEEHVSVFDCAFPPRDGKRSIAWRAHVLMMGAAQPFLSGAISKTVNMPKDATPDEIGQAYMEGWKIGLKALAVYRDGSKESQPLSTSKDDGKKEKEVRTVEKIVEKVIYRPRRERLPDTRQSVTHKFNVAGHEGYLTVGLYDDGRPGELFITMAKEGSTVGGMMDCFGTAVSMSLQYGVPLDVYVRKFSHTRFEPMGPTGNPEIPLAKSIVDYLFRWLGMRFIPGFREANSPKPYSELDSDSDSESDVAVIPPAPSASPADSGVLPVIAAPAAKANGNGNGNGNGHGKEKNGNGNGHGSHEPASYPPIAGAAPPVVALAQRPVKIDVPANRLLDAGRAARAKNSRDAQFAQFQTDSPACDVCGAITVRNGNCYLCHECGSSMGCS